MPPVSSVTQHAIPPFYACYLLRSTRRGMTYIGSTPDPLRRIKQHNGLIIGVRLVSSSLLAFTQKLNSYMCARGGVQGAFATKFWRPWEMELLCYGFPSKLQALQVRIISLFRTLSCPLSLRCNDVTVRVGMAASRPLSTPAHVRPHLAG